MRGKERDRGVRYGKIGLDRRQDGRFCTKSVTEKIEKGEKRGGSWANLPQRVNPGS